MKNFKTPFLSALVFFGTLLVLSVGYATWTSLVLSDADGGKPLTSTLLKGIMTSVNDIGTRTDGIYSVGGNIGIGTASPQENLHVSGRLRVDTISTQESIAAAAVSQTASFSSNMIFNTAGAPVLTIGTGTWLIFGSSFITTTDVPDMANLALYNATNTVVFGISGGGMTGYGGQIIGTFLSTTGYITINSGTKTIYLYGLRNGSSTLKMGTSATNITPAVLRAIRLF